LADDGPGRADDRIAEFFRVCFPEMAGVVSGVSLFDRSKPRTLMDSFVELLRGFLNGRNPKGCTGQEIADLVAGEMDILPESYRRFLHAAGNGVDDFLPGSDFTVSDLEGSRDAENEILSGSGLPFFPSDAFVFSMHQGYQFYFIHHGSVYYFLDGNEAVEKRFDSFDQFFRSVISEIEG
jgi:hypothetical protein